MLACMRTTFIGITWSAQGLQILLEERIRLMTAITPAYAHAYQSVCLAGQLAYLPQQRFRLPPAKARHSLLPNNWTFT